MKHIVVIIVTLFFALTTQGQAIFDYLRTYGNGGFLLERSRDQGFFKTPFQLLKNNKIVKEVIYDFKSSQPNSDSTKKEEFFYDNKGNGLLRLRVSYRDSYTDSLGYTYNKQGIHEIIKKTTDISFPSGISFFLTSFGYDTLTGDYSEYEYDYQIKPEKLNGEIAHRVNEKDSTYTISRYIHNYRTGGKILSWQQIFKLNKDGYLTGMEETQFNVGEKTARKFTFVLDKNNKYIKGVSVSSKEGSYKEEFVFDNQNRIVKIINKLDKKLRIKEFVYNVDGTIYKEITTNDESIEVKKHYYTKV